MINCDLQAIGKASRLPFCTHIKVLGPSKTLLPQKSVGLDSRAGSREKHETRVSRFSRDPGRVDPGRPLTLEKSETARRLDNTIAAIFVLFFEDHSNGTQSIQSQFNLINSINFTITKT